MSPRWCGPAPSGEVRVGAQVRAHGAEVPATATVDTGTDAVRVVLGERLRAPLVVDFARRYGEPSIAGVLKGIARVRATATVDGRL